MNKRQILLALALADFLALQAYVVWKIGYVGFFEQALSNLSGITITVDLVIALALVLVWMVRDARDRGISVLPYVVLTLGFGSTGPLAYLIRREAVKERTENANHARPTAVANARG